VLINCQNLEPRGPRKGIAKSYVIITSQGENKSEKRYVFFNLNNYILSLISFEVVISNFKYKSLAKCERTSPVNSIDNVLGK